MPGLSLAEAAGRVREAPRYAAMLARLGRDLPRFLRHPLALDDARRLVRHGVEHRVERFLDLMDRAVYGHPPSPYRRLLEHVGCEPGDLRALVGREGLEGAFGRLADLGVYITFEEFKGRQPAIRGSARFTFSDRDFDSPLCRHPHYVEFSGGSGGQPVPVYRTLDFIEHAAAMVGLAYEAHGIREPRHIIWRGPSPTLPLVHMKLSAPIQQWFTPVETIPLVARVGLPYIGMLARLAGHRLPMPTFCDLKDPEQIARLLVNEASPDRPIVVDSVISSAVRIAGAATAMGRSLSGVTFHCGSEPLSPARRRLIEEVGAGIVVDYSSNELAAITSGCAHGTAPDDVHLMLNLYAVIERERALFAGGPSVDALLFTTLSPTAAKIGLNVELGDSARVERRQCGCLLGSLGLQVHLSEIRSFEKLSSEGTTFYRSNVIQILEEVLPARFGGTALDYQLVEAETEAGDTRLVLRIHPRVGPLDEGAIRSMLLGEMRRGGLMNAYHASLIERAESVEVHRLPPLATPAGKVLPFQLQKWGTKTPV